MYTYVEVTIPDDISQEASDLSFETGSLIDQNFAKSAELT